MPKKKKAESAPAKVAKVMGEFKSGEFKSGELKSGSGAKVKDRKQAVAIALNEARKEGAGIPPK